MSKKETSLESFFEKGERLNDETAEDSKTANRMKVAFKRKYYTTAAALFKSLNDYISGKLNSSFCAGICTDGVAAMTGQLSGFTTRVKEVASECESTHCVIHREMLAS